MQSSYGPQVGPSSSVRFNYEDPILRSIADLRTASGRLGHSSRRCRTRWHTTPSSLKRAGGWPLPYSTMSRTSSSTLGWTISSPSRTSSTSHTSRRTTTRRRKTTTTTRKTRMMMRRTPTRESRTPMRRTELHRSLGGVTPTGKSLHLFFLFSSHAKKTTKIMIVVMNK